MKRLAFLKRIITGGAAVAVSPLLPAQQPSPVHKPVKEISLSSPYIAGFQFYPGDRDDFTTAPGEDLSLVREPKNPFDRYAVAIYCSGCKLGYIPARENRIIARMIDQQVRVSARVKYFDKGEPSYRRLRISLFYLS